MNEHSFVKSVHRKLPIDLYKWKIHDSYTNGVPDAMYAGDKAILFIEYKYVPALPKIKTTPIKINLSKLQLQWLNNFVDMGHNAVVVVGTEDKNVLILQNKQWNKPVSKENFLKKAVKPSDLSNFILNVCTNIEKPVR